MAVKVDIVGILVFSFYIAVRFTTSGTKTKTRLWKGA